MHEIRRSLEVLKTRAGDRIRPGDISLLSWDELRAVLLDGAVPDVDLVGRHDELVAAGATPVPAATHTAGKKVLRGIGASTGRVQGRAVVVTDPLDPLPDGDILVAHATDTAWTPVFLGMAAVVTDSGQLMSHSSIVARDLGIPAVVGTEHATSVIVTGDRTDVDGDQGVVLVG